MNQLKQFRRQIPLYYLERDGRVSQKNKSKLFKRISMIYTFLDSLETTPAPDGSSQKNKREMQQLINYELCLMIHNPNQSS